MHGNRHAGPAARGPPPRADLPAPGSAYALLIGAAEFSDSAHYVPLPSAHKSVGKLAELLQAQHSEHAMWQSPYDRIEVLGQP